MSILLEIFTLQNKLDQVLPDVFTGTTNSFEYFYHVMAISFRFSDLGLENQRLIFLANIKKPGFLMNPGLYNLYCRSRLDST
jgi:hypothetical protein